MPHSLKARLGNLRYKKIISDKDYDRLCKALEQESSREFAKWVASEIFDELWEYNKESFDELACRKLAKLGIVRAKGDEWELVEPQESEVIL